MLLRTIRCFTNGQGVGTSSGPIGEIVIALPPEVAAAPPAWITDRRVRVRLVAGGPTRAESVRAALAAAPEHLSIVLVHDAARPFVSPETIRAVIARARRGVAAVAAVPVSDTIKRADPSGSRIVATLDRGGLWRAQTPQGFPRAVLEAAYAAAPTGPDPLSATDDAALAEAAGFPVDLVLDRGTNIKITTADDLVFAEALARA